MTLPPVDFSRVAVVGLSCSGKTTLAGRLASRLHTRCIELDALYWGPEWTPRPDFEQRVLEAVQQPCWVIDGNYSLVRDSVWRSATAIVWIDYSFPVVLSRALRRTARRVFLRERLYGGNQESLRDALFDVETPLWLVVRTYRRRRREFAEFFNRPEYRHANVIRLQAPWAAEKLLTEVSTQSRCAFAGQSTHTDAG